MGIQILSQNQKNQAPTLIVVQNPKVVRKVDRIVIRIQKVQRVKILNLILIQIKKMEKQRKRQVIKVKKMIKNLRMKEKKLKKKKKMNLKKTIIKLKMKKKNTENCSKEKKYAIQIPRMKKVKMRRKFLGLFYLIIHIKKCGICSLLF
jgi:type II secretory pathway component HofQ